MELLLQALHLPVFTVAGMAASRLELLGFVLSLAMVVCNLREVHWGWPLAIASSALYGGVFWRSGLYADALLQVFFIGIAVWGWAQWLRGGGSAATAAAPLRIAVLPWRGRLLAVAAVAVLWPVIAAALLRFTDSTVPWWDAFPTAASLVAQVLLGRKYLENWLLWLLVNGVSVGLFAAKGLGLTAVLYAVFAVLSVAGWVEWRRRMAARSSSSSRCSNRSHGSCSRR